MLLQLCLSVIVPATIAVAAGMSRNCVAGAQLGEDESHDALVVTGRHGAEQPTGAPWQRASRLVVNVPHFDCQSQIGLAVVERQDQRHAIADAHFVMHMESNAA